MAVSPLAAEQGRWGDGGVWGGGAGRWGDGEIGRWGDGEIGRWGDREMGRWGDGEMGREFLSTVPDSRLLFPVPCSLFPVPCSPLPIPDSRLPFPSWEGLGVGSDSRFLILNS
ncbi:MAG: hypothetical protein F6K50_29255 [Moorea sp. SIO3I7]|uniref:hypothetical protein n=1 Tax=unclassified Moorena TaxID=2683338 RepID=UPI0013BEFB89|nr:MULTISPECIES: hypothetical protein [unclassified Moorena]NEN99425.1 hypothetical protein [Moorena sp. SIO3I7]NEO10342.1 hypothetical protein [Moorena sp. SIO3I8]NEO20701.1 hypothetical protein [Moorena sp. SIO4A5]NEQ61489.1 hypothetical protein [Moorena sp. SIO4A1]